MEENGTEKKERDVGHAVHCTRYCFEFFMRSFVSWKRFQEYIFSIVFCKTDRDVSKQRDDETLLLNYNLTHHATSSLLLLLGIPIACSIGSVLPQALRSALSDPHDRS